ncbi:MAG TPA: EthD domain-containing protein [Myxococcota bacterium]|nr:EthD domain-containing protein [Myxococcota bacterium]
MRALIHFAPRAGAGERFGSRISSLVAALRASAAPRGLAVNALSRLARDAFGKHTPFRAGIEVTGGDGPGEITELLADLGAQVDDVAHPDASTLLIGSDAVFVASERAPVRYQYLMRRNASFTHETYLEYYRTRHSRFGIATPGTLGYVQLHVDLGASRSAAARAGLGIWGFDSVSELHLASQEAFLRALAESGFGTEPIADEEIFVDRPNSLDLCSAVDWGVT